MAKSNVLIALLLASALGTVAVCGACGGGSGNQDALVDGVAQDSNGQDTATTDTNGVDTNTSDTNVDPSLPPEGDENVFFVGHSLVGWDAPEILEAFAADADVGYAYEASIGIGAPLTVQWDMPGNSEGANPRDALSSRPFTSLLLTEAVPIEPNVTWNNTSEIALRFANLAYAQNPNVQVYIYETWEHMDNGVDAWEQATVNVRRFYDQTYNEFNAGFAGRDARLIPGGQALLRLVQAIRAGQVPGISNYRDLFTDTIHLTGAGWYFIGCVFYAAIYGASPEGRDVRPTDRFDQPLPLPPASAIPVMQRIAWEVVSSDPLSGR